MQLFVTLSLLSVVSWIFLSFVSYSCSEFCTDKCILNGEFGHLNDLHCDFSHINNTESIYLARDLLDNHLHLIIPSIQ